MPWSLTTPINAGDIGGTSTEVKIIQWTHDVKRKSIRIRLEYGNTVDDVWKRETAPPVGMKNSLTIEGDEYDALVSSNPQLYTDVKAALYNAIEAAGNLGDGSIV